MKITIIIPVYNEAEALPQFLFTLKEQINLIKNHDIYVLIFDSHSTDGTSRIIEKWQKKWSKLLSITEKQKSGLGSAYLQGMNYAINNLNSEAIFQCDGDGSHNPKYIAGMIKLFEEGYDVVVGSRYIKGGGLDTNWAWHRRLISELGNYTARNILSHRYKDYTSGFKLIRSSILKPVLTQKFFSNQFAFQINLLWYLHKKNAKIIEFPIHFIDREKGYSKFPRHNIMQSLYVLLRLRINDLKDYLQRIKNYYDPKI